MRQSQDEWALITGAGSGIGRALSTKLAAEGIGTILVGRTSEPLTEVAAICGALNDRRVLTVPMDVSDRDGWRRLADRVRTELGSVDTLCLNAGVTTAGPLVGHSFEEWTWVYDTVLWGIVHGIEAFVPAMTAAGRGRVLITGSLAGLVPDMFLGHGPYVSAKAAVTALALGLRAELAPQGVGVSVLIPGPTATGLPAAVRPAAATVTDGIAPDPMGLIRPRSDLPAPLTGAPDWLESEDVAERALDGLRRNEAFIATHPHMRPVVDEYLGRVQAAFTHTAVTTTAIDAPL